MTTKFYTFSQNNSGGSFSKPAIFLIVEASNSDEAANIAMNHGVYFNGVDGEMDCECCGDRWYDSPDVSDTPSIYGKTPEEYMKNSITSYFASDEVPLYKIIYK